MFVVVFDVQKNQIKKWCWGSCGKGKVGAIQLDGFHFIGCEENKCPHLDKEMSEPFISMENGEPLFMRRLKER